MVTSESDSASRAGEQRYRQLFEHMPICIFVADLTVIPVTILEVNQRAELVYGYTAAELVGMPAAQLAPEDARPTLLSVIQRVQQGETVTIESISRHRDGTRFPVRVIAAPDPTDTGRMIATVEDITAEKQRRSEGKPSTPSAAASPMRSMTAWRKVWPGCASNRRCGLTWPRRLPPACAPLWTSCRPCLLTPSQISAARSSPCARWT